MGGRGSGRRSGYDGKPETHRAMPLDIRKISRSGLLVPGNSFNWQGAALNIRVESHALLLSYRQRSTCEIVEQPLQMEMTGCRFGGQRPWFICPRCSRRVAVLYAPGGYFACRQCGGLAYASQKEGLGDRSTRQADRIRKRMGWPAGIIQGSGAKPKGMHWKTFWHLKTEHDALVQISFRDLGRKLGFLHRLLER